VALVPYLNEADLEESYRDLLENPINIMRAVANSPEGLRHFTVLPSWIRFGCELNPRLRELVIIQVGYLTRSRYEYAHHLQSGLSVGVTEADIHDLIAFDAGLPHGLGELEALALEATRQITLDREATPETFQALEAHLGRARAVDLVLAASCYNAVVRILGTLQVDVEPEWEKYLERFPLPQ
jgi:alkylhydroperoxidase family enzyme